MSDAALRGRPLIVTVYVLNKKSWPYIYTTVSAARAAIWTSRHSIASRSQHAKFEFRLTKYDKFAFPAYKIRQIRIPTYKIP